MGWPKPVLIVIGRITLGVMLAAVFSAIGIGVGWGMFVFFGAAAHTTLLVLFMSGAGVGAGIGSFGAWLKIDSVPSPPLLAASILVMIVAGIAGAWGGFQFGAAQEVKCCVGPPITPITYTAIGATLAANVAALAVAAAQDTRVRSWWAKVHSGIEGSPSNSSGGAKPVSE